MEARVGSRRANMPKANGRSERVDLESAICDVADMADVCVILMRVLEQSEIASAKQDVSAQQALDGVAYWRDAVSFSVLHLKGMTAALKEGISCQRGIKDSDLHKPAGPSAGGFFFGTIAAAGIQVQAVGDSSKGPSASGLSLWRIVGVASAASGEINPGVAI